VDFDDLRDQLEDLVEAGEPGRFLYCAADGDGEPSLRIGVPRIGAVHQLLLLKTAEDKELVAGEALHDAGVFTFRGTSSHGSFGEHLTELFALHVDELEGAVVELPEPVVEEPAAPEVVDFGVVAPDPASLAVASAAPAPAPAADPAPAAAPASVPAAAPATVPAAAPASAPAPAAAPLPTDPIELALAGDPVSASLLERREAASVRSAAAADLVWASSAGAAARDVARSLARAPTPAALSGIVQVAATAAATPERARWLKTAAKELKLRQDLRKVLDHEARDGTALGRDWLARRDNPPAFVGGGIPQPNDLGAALARGEAPIEGLRALTLRHAGEAPLRDKLQEQVQRGLRREAKALSQNHDAKTAATTRVALQRQIDALFAVAGLPPLP